MTSSIGDLNEETAKLDGWKITNDKLFKSYRFKSHLEALKFVEAVSLEAISCDRYPKIVFSFETVELYLPEGDSDLSPKDFPLALKIDKFSDSYEHHNQK